MAAKYVDSAPDMLHSSPMTNGLETGRSRSPLKLLPDTRLTKFSTMDKDSGYSHSFNGPGRFSFKGRPPTSMADPTTRPYSSGSGHFSSALSDSYNVPDDFGNRSFDFARTNSDFQNHNYGNGGTINTSTNGLPSRVPDVNRPYDDLLVTKTYVDNGINNSRIHDSVYDGSFSARDSNPSKSFLSRDSGIFNESRLNTSGGLPSKIGSLLDRSKSKSSTLLDLQAQLEDSEQRRTLLMEKLADAKATIKQQADQLERTEYGYRDTTHSLDDYKFREKEHRKKVEQLENEKQEYQSKRLESLKHREELQERVGGLENEIKMLKTSLTLIETESKRKDEVLQQTTQAMNMMEEEQLKLVKVKESSQKELGALKESLDIARSRNEWLENQMQDSKSEGDRLRQINHSLSMENRSISNQLAEFKQSTALAKEEQSSYNMQLRTLKEEKAKLQRQLETFQENVADLKATLASTSSDKERFFQEKLDLHQRMQTLALEKDTAVKEKCAIEEQMNEMNAQMAEVRLKTDKEKDEGRKMHDELAAVKKVGEVLSLELASTKANLEKCIEQNHSLEQTKKIAFQQHALYEQEIRSLEAQIENLKKTMESLRSTHMKEREGLDDGTIKLKDELRQTRSERNQLELSKHELEAKLKQAELNLKENNDLLRREMDTWKTNCEKMTASLSRKEMEVQQLHKKLEDFENQSGLMKMNQHTFENQYEELTQSRDEILRLQSENRRLLQERAENQQVIQLLEMQKNILSKTVNDLNSVKNTQSEESQSRVQDITQLQCQHELLQKEHHSLQEKVLELEKIKEQFIKEKENKLEDYTTRSNASSVGSIETQRGRIHDLEKQNQQLREVNNMVTEQLTRTEKEVKHFKEQDLVPRQDYRRLAIEKQSAEESLAHVRDQLKKVEEMYHKLLADRESNVSSRRGSDVEIIALKHEKEALAQKTQSLEKQITLVENSKKRTEDQNVKLSQQLDELSQKLISSSQDQTVQVTSLQKQNNQLQSELEEAKSIQRKQDALIQSLKEELDDEKTKKPHQIRQTMDDVGNELNVMRRELQKLMGVINMKDQEISTLNTQLKNTKQEVSHSLAKENDDLQERNKELEQKTSDQNDEIDNLRHALKGAKTEMQKLQQDVETIQEGQDQGSSSRALENLRKELAGKNRQIESLEEQLRRNTSAEIRRLKREAGKVELLKSENRRLENEIRRSKGKPERVQSRGPSQSHESMESDEVDQSPLYDYGRSLKTESMDESEKSALQELQEDEDVRNVVTMLENVEFSDTLGMSTSQNFDLEHDDAKDNDGDVTGSDPDRSDSERDRTPRAEEDEDSRSYSRDTSYSTRKSSRFSHNKEEEDGSYPTPTVTTDGPTRTAALKKVHYPEKESEGSYRNRARSASRSPPRSSDRTRSYGRPEKDSNSYYRSMSTDRALSSRSYDVSLGYGSLASSGERDLHAHSLPHDPSTQRYRSHLAELGPAPGESKDERRRRMRELLRTLDRPPARSSAAYP